MGIETKSGVQYAWFSHATCGLLGFATTPKGDKYQIWYFQVCLFSVHCRNKDIRKEFLDQKSMEKFLEKN